MAVDTSLIPPSNEEILGWEFIEVHFAAFWLTGWPTVNGEAYFPDPTAPFNMADYGQYLEFTRMMLDIEKAIKDHTLPAKHSSGIVGVVHAVRPMDVLDWALLNGFILPKHLQSTINLHQLESKGWSRAKRALINKVIFQYILKVNPHFTTQKQFFDHHWLKEFGDGDYSDSGQKALKAQLAEAVNFKPARGRNTSQLPLKILPIAEVASTDIMPFQLNVEAFIELVKTVCLICQTMRRKTRKEAFFNRIIAHPAVKPYLKKASSAILRIVKRVCYQFYGTYSVRILSVPSQKSAEIDI